MSDCIFCKISKGEIPSNTVYEDNDFRVILDLSPANEGHCLVIPKKHARNILELDGETVSKAFSLAKKIAEALIQAVGCDGVNVLQNNGEAAGQTVDHFHIHVIPRTKNDGVVIKSEPVKMSETDFANTRDKIKAAVK